jgi:hypothetical protein
VLGFKLPHHQDVKKKEAKVKDLQYKSPFKVIPIRNIFNFEQMGGFQNRNHR